ncbi:MAG TPA: chemotaxis protein CheX [Vicinamibacterales bacterium]
MSSSTLRTPPVLDANGAAIRDAVSAVAGQSFFAMVEDAVHPAAAASRPLWLFSVVRFDNGDTTGSLVCWLPPGLAHALFDSFSGRDPSEPPPAAHLINDLVGEFLNMVCGDWLCRSRGRAFQLSPPIVVRAPQPEGAGRQRLWVKVNDHPIAFEWEITSASGVLQDGR